MLVLTRKVKEQVIVPACDLIFTILEIHKDKVRVGVSAPSDLKVHRYEVWARICAEPEVKQEAKAQAVV